MELKRAIKGQYLAGLAMLRQCVERCPDDLWSAGTFPRLYWRIAYHAVFYAHLYSQPGYDQFVPWELDREDATDLWGEPKACDPYTKAEILGYIDFVVAGIPGWVDALDLDSESSGFDWYPNFPKLDHVILSVRHVQGHVGQLAELLMARGIDNDWVSRR